MNSTTKIALIGFSTLEVIALRTLLQEDNGCMTESFSTFKEFEPFAERMDGYIVERGNFVENLDFYLPKRGRTMVVTEGKKAETEKNGMRILFSGEDEPEIKAEAESFLKMIKGVEISGELSGREIEVLRLIAKGKINKEIADELCISINTVITHRKNISVKLGVKSASGMSLYAMMNGII
ncbi:MAG: helix-turn-helix transcriptional regulator [Muribaculaceae bacterium]|nr:helix-turn-helix transcriptional regulator [Muribaculaceae bacterium]